jgi:D-threo-aldose 1-dehydrogenase
MNQADSLLRRVGSSRLAVGPLGLGCAPLGNLYTVVSDADARATLAGAAGAGIRWFDVAPYYGFGLAEQRLGDFLRSAPPLQPIISTKVGRILQPVSSVPSHPHFASPLPNQPVFDFSSAGIERSYEDSLRRLGVDRVSILLLHDVDYRHHPTAHRALSRQLLEEALPTLNRIKREGGVDAIGLGVGEYEIGYEILLSAEIDCVLLAGRYTLLDQSASTSGFLDACLRRGVAVFAAGVFNSGFLAGGSSYEYQPANEGMLRRREKLLALAKSHGVPLGALALQFTAAHPAITSVVVGARSPREMAEILEWHRTRIRPDLWAALRTAGLIPPEVPVPAAG